MAAKEPLQSIKAEVTCPICLELFRDPVTTECEHSFCRECIARHCQGDGDVVCPLCNKKLQKRHLRPNRELKNIVETLRLQVVEDPRGGNMCERHEQPLQLYCKEHQTPICLVCRESQAHRGHTVVPVEEAVQEHWETIRKHLTGIESTYGKVHPLVSMDRKHLSPSAIEEVHKSLTELTDNTATLLKVDVKGRRSRFEKPTSAGPSEVGVEKKDSVSPAGQGAAQTEFWDHTGREPGSEPAAEKQEETGSHVGRVREEAPTPRYGLDQTSLDPAVHRISDTTEGAEPKVDATSLRSRYKDATSPRPSVDPARSRKDGASSGGNVAALTELPKGKARKTPRRKDSLPASEEHEPEDAKRLTTSPQDLSLVGAALEPGWRRQDRVSPAGNETPNFKSAGASVGFRAVLCLGIALAVLLFACVMFWGIHTFLLRN